MSGVVVSGLAFSLASAFMHAHASDQHFVTIGTGGVTGVYYPAGGATCKLLNLSRQEHGARCSAESTLGSISNIRKLRSADIDFGYVQSDWLHHAFYGTARFEEDGPFEELRSVFYLHPEVATLVVRADEEFQTLDDLKSAKVNIGGKGSGSEASWNVLVDTIGWTEADKENLTHLGSSELADALCAGEIDAYFALIGHPAALIEETNFQCDIRLIGFDHETVQLLTKDVPYYLEAKIPAGLYGQREAVSSFGGAASLVTSAMMPDEIVRTVVETIYNNFDDLKKLHPALSQLEPGDLVANGNSVPLHRGALKFYQEQGLLPESGSEKTD
ncbi:TAXI family TRAP transporter solute-binding subunit [Roseibium sp. SCP14]|uniref:TAXI family TRAP transporter solute-binding subunit n=1 Tax=Roseibium sp. SCP14 TaxID=3141375 RepID=UPI00333AA7E3